MNSFLIPYDHKSRHFPKLRFRFLFFFVSTGFPYKDQNEELFIYLFIVMVYFLCISKA